MSAPSPTHPAPAGRGTETEMGEQLEWSKTLCGGRSVPYAEAEKAVAELGSEWRIPTDKDWDTVIDRSKYGPALDTNQVPDPELGWHWTSTPCPWASESAVFVVSSNSGGVLSGNRSGHALVRAVRAVSGQSSDL